LRTQTADEAIELVEQLAVWRMPRVVALSIDGNEAAAGRTGPRFAEAFRKAGASGLKRTVHAGESSGPEGVRDAIELLGADRIDHGVRAIEDDAVVALLAERGIPLGVCPTSNIALKVYSSMEAHPLDRLRRAGVRVSINTDDPSLLGTNLPREYEIARATYGWTEDVLCDLARTSIDASFAGPDVKEKMRGNLSEWGTGLETFDEKRS
jgi:adenosine deaminase